MEAKMLKMKNSVGYSPIYDDDFSEDDEIIYSDETHSDNDYDESCTVTTKSTKSTTNTKLSIKRMPTRKPDPKVSNRNAIMARENRRKKKEHMEVLQKTVEDTQTENKKLKKMLCIRNNTITKLTQENLYLRSILANKTEIMSLLRSIQGNRTPITSSVLSFVADNNYKQENTNTMHHSSMRNRLSKNSSSSSGCSPASASSMSPASYEDDKENDLDNGSHTDFTATESTSSYDQNIDDFHWENLLNEPTTTAFKSDFNPMNIADLREIDDSEILSG